MRRRQQSDIHELEAVLQAPVYLRRRRGLRRLSLLINRRGQVQISIPWQLSDDLALRFALENLAWLQEQIQRHRAQPARRRPLLRVDGQVPFLGREFRLRWVTHQGRPRAEFSDGELRVLCRACDADLWRKLIRREYETQARWFIAERVAYWASKMRESYGKVSFRAQRTRWGSCTPSGNLSFNWKLMFAPEEVIDYVVIHELAHRAHLDHSEKFWLRVAEFDPQFEEHKRYLKRNQDRVDFLDGFDLLIDESSTSGIADSNPIDRELDLGKEHSACP